MNDKGIAVTVAAVVIGFCVWVVIKAFASTKRDTSMGDEG